jgi:hypothetical protein
MLTELEKKKIKRLPGLKGSAKWKTSHIVKNKTRELVNDLIFLLEHRESVGTLCEVVGENKTQNLLKLLASDFGMEQSVLSPNFVVSIIEENRVLAEIISKKNRVWRDLVAQVNSAKNLEDFVNSILKRDNVYFVEGDNVRVHLRRNYENKGN